MKCVIQGKSCNAASVKFDIAANTVRNWYKRYQLECYYKEKAHFGKKGKIDKIEKIYFAKSKSNSGTSRKTFWNFNKGRELLHEKIWLYCTNWSITVFSNNYFSSVMRSISSSFPFYSMCSAVPGSGSDLDK
ncbi:helix-turn-helix domain-containing protein [Orientia tsutsugamushi]|uniref:helix-turn-helix domain-containing protein n=3 Tax=Orientia tsutsugamushi TaxID=784 RepID=UPI00315DFBFD